MNFNKNFDRQFDFVRGFIILVAMGMLFWIFLVIGSSMTGNGMLGDYTWGINGPVETRCIGGYKFVVSDAGRRFGGNNVTQMIDENGHAVRCQ